MKSGLKVENLYFKDILTDVNIELKPGTISALVGKSGSGKTLLLKSIVGFIDYSGTISLDGVVFDKNTKINSNLDLYANWLVIENPEEIPEDVPNDDKEENLTPEETPETGETGLYIIILGTITLCISIYFYKSRLNNYN